MPGDTSSSSLFGRMSARSSFMSRKDIKVSVQLLDDSETVTNEFKRSQTGQDILDYVCECMNLKEKDYFGLRYQDHHKHRYWVDLSLPISHICKLFKSDNLALRLRFRYYPSDVHQLREELTRYQLFVQLQRDLLHGRLYCPQVLSVQLAAYILQSQLGDYNEETANGDKYVSEYKLLVKQTPKMETKIAEQHKELRGMKASEAEMKLLELASQAETYGFDPYTIKEPKNPSTTVYIGATHRGILIYHGSQKAHHIEWNELSKVDYFGNELTITPAEGYEPLQELNLSKINNNNNNNTSLNSNGAAKGEKKSSRALRYVCPSRSYAKHLWVHILSQKAFFNEPSAELIKPLFSKPRIPLLTRGSTFRFPSARVQREIEAAPSIAEPREMSFSRYPLPRQTPRAEQPWLAKYTTLPNMKLQQNGEEKRAGLQNGELPSSLSSPAARSVDSLSEDAASPCLAPGPSQPSPSTATADSAEMPFPKHNVSTFTVRMIKVERADGSRLEHSVVESPIVAQLRAPLATSTPLPPATNGVGKRRPEQENGVVQAEKQGRGWVAACLNLLFISLLLLLILAAVVIAVFERQELTWVDDYPVMASLRHDVYEPARHTVLARYNNVFK